MLDMEEQLQSSQLVSMPSETVVSADKQNGRITRGVNISTKYRGLMSKNRREKVERETFQSEASESIIMEKEVLLCLYLLSNRNSLF